MYIGSFIKDFLLMWVRREKPQIIAESPVIELKSDEPKKQIVALYEWTHEGDWRFMFSDTPEGFEKVIERYELKIMFYHGEVYYLTRPVGYYYRAVYVTI